MSRVNNPSKSYEPTAGQYTGDDAADRAIPHGLGSIPATVLIWAMAQGYTHALYAGVALIGRTTTIGEAVTAPDATNFYVGGGAGHEGNKNTVIYNWIAFP